MTERNTKQKQIIIDVVKSHDNHPTADEIYSFVHEKDSRISKATVYRVLHQLAKNGEICEVDSLPCAGRYDKRNDKHHHILCEKCGSVFDAPVDYDEFQDRKLEEITGFKIKRHEIIFRGICEKCLSEITRGDNKN